MEWCLDNKWHTLFSGMNRLGYDLCVINGLTSTVPIQIERDPDRNIKNCPATQLEKVVTSCISYVRILLGKNSSCHCVVLAPDSKISISWSKRQNILSSQRRLPCKWSSIVSLIPHLARYYIVWDGGRIDASKLPYTTKHSKILPQDGCTRAPIQINTKKWVHLCTQRFSKMEHNGAFRQIMISGPLIS